MSRIYLTSFKGREQGLALRARQSEWLGLPAGTPGEERPYIHHAPIGPLIPRQLRRLLGQEPILSDAGSSRLSVH